MLQGLGNYHSIIFDFDGVFTDNFLSVDENGTESVRVSRGDGYAIDLLKRYCRIKEIQLSMLILSTESNKVVLARARKLQIECVSGQSDKLSVLLERFKKLRPEDENPFSGLIYFGNDLNDLPVILKAGFSLVPVDAHIRVKEAASYISTRRGGQEFVREGVEFLLGIDAMSMEELSELISNR